MSHMQPRLIPAIIAHHIHLEALVESSQAWRVLTRSRRPYRHCVASVRRKRARRKRAQLLSLSAPECRERVDVSLYRPLRDTLGSVRVVRVCDCGVENTEERGADDRVAGGFRVTRLGIRLWQRDIRTRSALARSGFSNTMAGTCGCGPGRAEVLEGKRAERRVDPQQLSDELVMCGAAADEPLRVMYNTIEVVPALLMPTSGAKMLMHSP